MYQTNFINSNDRLFMKVRPFVGKYSVKCIDFYEQIDHLQQKKMDAKWKYRPLNSEIEITNCCNQSCPHCGMAANGLGGIKYTEKELIDFVNQLYENGIPSYSITGGEPFIEFPNMLKMIQASKGKVDVCKITSNGFWGEEPQQYFDALVEAGILENLFFVPCLMISIGEQTTPMEDTCNIFHYAIRNFSKTELTLCISSLSEYGSKSRIEEFLSVYYKYFGNFPENRVFLTENFYRNSKSIRKNASNIDGRNVAKYMEGPVRCFEPTIGKYILPRMLVKADGSVCTCACFNPPEKLRIGNIKEESMRKVLEKINANPYVNIIAEDGLHNFKNWIDIEKCATIPCNNECEACRYLIEEYDKRRRK